MNHVHNFLRWMEDEGKDRKTIVAYRSILDQFLTWYEGTAGHRNLAEVKPVDIKEYLSYLRHTLNRKQATINKATASLKTFFAYLADNGIIRDNPMTRIKIQKVSSTDKVGEKGAMKWLTKEEQDRFISYVELERNEFKRLRNLAIIDLMLYAGLRVSEIEELKIDDLNVNGNITITIREGKKGKYSTVTLIDKYSKNVRRWLKYRVLLTDEKYMESPYLFVSERSGKIGARGIQVMLNKYAQLAGMKNITPHRFRHSFCKNLANAGTPIEIICKLARHESIETTKIYVDASQEEMLKALKNM
jgi:site-specific recombinase XerD